MVSDFFRRSVWRSASVHTFLLVGLLLGALASASPLAPTTRVHAAVETLAVSLPSGTPGGRQDGFLSVAPFVGIGGEGDFALELGPRFRLRIFDAAPEQREGDLGWALRRQDWDEPSDFGQLVRLLRYGEEGDRFHLEVAPRHFYRLGRGQLVNRYRTRAIEDTHASSASVALQTSLVRLELFASDVLAARVFAGELSFDFGGALSPAIERRFYLHLQAAHDFGQGLLRTESVTLVHGDLSAVLYRGRGFWVSAFGGGGMRPGYAPARSSGFSPTRSLGALGGLSIEGTGSSVQAGAKLELRHNEGGFRYGFIGPGYELARFTDVGLSGPSVASVSLPRGKSLAAEVSVQLGRAVGNPDGRSGAWLSAAVEHFAWGRTDADVSLALHFLEGRAISQGRATLIGLGQQTRLSVDADTRFRLGPALYAVAFVGTSFFPQLDATLVRGVTAGAGLGVDFER